MRPSPRPATRYWIVLVDYNGLEDTRKCLESLEKVTGEFETVVVDNCSKVNVREALASHFPKAHFVRSDINGGWAGGNNIGMKFAFEHGGEVAILLNNDTTVPPEFNERLQAAMDAHPAYGILGPIIRFMEPPHEIQTEGVVFNRPNEPGFFQKHRVPLSTQNPPLLEDVDIVNGCCLMVRKSVVDKIGYIDEEYFLIHEESDFCLRCQEAGFKNGVLGESLVFHKGSSSFKREGKRLQRYFDARNLGRLLTRHRDRRTSRGVLSSRIHHWKYAYYRYAIERENGFPDSGEAVIEGMYDSLRGYWGGYSQRPRPGLAVLRAMFSLAWRLSGSRKPKPEANSISPL
ncbi:MAG: glycosyltransferase family 2 protein [Fimbriiglobus sp.]